MIKRIDSTSCLPPVVAGVQAQAQGAFLSHMSEQALADVQAVRRLPLPVAAASQLALPGAVVGAWVHGTRVLLTTGDGIEVRAFAPPRFTAEESENGTDAQELPCVKRLGLIWVIATPQAGFDWNGYFGALGAEMLALGFDDDSVSIHQRSFVQPSNWKRVLEARLHEAPCQGTATEPAPAAAVQASQTTVREAAGDHQRIVKRRRRSAAGDERGAKHRHSGINEFIYLFFPCTLLVWDGDHYNLVTASPGEDGQSCTVNSWMMVPGQFRWRVAEHWVRSDKLFWHGMSQDFFAAAVNQHSSSLRAIPAVGAGYGDVSVALFNECLQRHSPNAC
ncbi:MAG: hypothetical protein H7332_16680 [Bdellovibrionales bacterium]|nr:hypothetical protein [Ramlibacter sp.]